MIPMVMCIDNLGYGWKIISGEFSFDLASQTGTFASVNQQALVLSGKHTNGTLHSIFIGIMRQKPSVFRKLFQC